LKAGGTERITGPADPRVADYRDIAEPELVRSRGLFVGQTAVRFQRPGYDYKIACRSL
jgi:hypothetical protein